MESFSPSYCVGPSPSHSHSRWTREARDNTTLTCPHTVSLSEAPPPVAPLPPLPRSRERGLRLAAYTVVSSYVRVHYETTYLPGLPGLGYVWTVPVMPRAMSRSLRPPPP